jgi:hypothetical protein
MSASGQSWTDKPTTTRWGKWEAKVEGGIGWSATEGAEVTAEVDVDVEFDHHANPTYSYTPS